MKLSEQNHKSAVLVKLLQWVNLVWLPVKSRELTERLGERVKHATITAVKNATGKEYKFAPLRKWCHENQVEATEVPDIRYGQVKSWPAESWRQVTGIRYQSEIVIC